MDDETTIKSCKTCYHLRCTRKRVCGNQQAIAVNGTAKPIQVDCNYWGSYWDILSKKFSKDRTWISIPA